MNDTSAHETFTFEGIEFDLEIAYRDVTGVEWKWSGENSLAGEPLMRECGRAGEQTLVPLPDLYRYNGPLIPIHDRPSPSDFRAAIDPDYVATVAAGYVEDHIVAVVAPVLSPHQLPPAPLHFGWRGFLRSLHRDGE